MKGHEAPIQVVARAGMPCRQEGCIVTLTGVQGQREGSGIRVRSTCVIALTEVSV